MTHVQVREARKGFTLVEILVAIAIVAIAAVMIGPNLMKYIAGAKVTTTKSNLRTIKTAIDQFYLDIGTHPNRLRDLVRKPREENLAKKWTQRYLDAKNVPPDGWGFPFQYKKTPGQKNPYELYSYGSDAGKDTPKSDWVSVWDL